MVKLMKKFSDGKSWAQMLDTLLVELTEIILEQFLDLLLKTFSPVSLSTYIVSSYQNCTSIFH